MQESFLYIVKLNKLSLIFNFPLLQQFLFKYCKFDFATDL